MPPAGAQAERRCRAAPRRAANRLGLVAAGPDRSGPWPDAAHRPVRSPASGRRHARAGARRLVPAVPGVLSVRAFASSDASQDAGADRPSFGEARRARPSGRQAVAGGVRRAAHGGQGPAAQSVDPKNGVSLPSAAPAYFSTHYVSVCVAPSILNSSFRFAPVALANGPGLGPPTAPACAWARR